MNPHETRVSRDGTLLITFPNVTGGFEQWVLLTSDRHWDSPDSDRTMQKRHLEEARERGAMVLDLGDLFDAMGGRRDPRGSRGSVRAEHNVDAYFTELLNGAVEWFKPYAHLFKLIAAGNHETAILRHNEIDLTRQLVRLLNAEVGSQIHAGHYAGWVRFTFRQPSGASVGNHAIRYTHGSGSAAPVTRGVIQTNRRAVYLPDAHTVLSGHTHQAWKVPIVRERLSQRGNVSFDEQTHVQIPSYKRSSPHVGWAAERGFAPAPVGAWWLRFWFRNHAVHHEFTRAQ